MIVFKLINLILIYAGINQCKKRRTKKQRFALEKLHSNNVLLDSSWWTVAAPFTSSQCVAILSVLGVECRRASCCCSIPLHYLDPPSTNPLSGVASWLSHNTLVKTKDLPAHQPPPPTSLNPTPPLSDISLTHPPRYGLITQLKSGNSCFPSCRACWLPFTKRWTWIQGRVSEGWVRGVWNIL